MNVIINQLLFEIVSIFNRFNRQQFYNESNKKGMMGAIKAIFGLLVMGVGGWILVKYSLPMLFLFFKISPLAVFMGFPYSNMYFLNLFGILLLMIFPLFLLWMGYSLIKD